MKFLEFSFFYLKCVCKAWKKPIIHLSSNINGVDVEPPKPERAGADKSNSRKHGNPLRYGSSCGPRNILLSANITCKFDFKILYYSVCFSIFSFCQSSK